MYGIVKDPNPDKGRAVGRKRESESRAERAEETD